MRCTRRRLDRGLVAAVVLVSSAAGVGTVSCSSPREPLGASELDAAAGGSNATEDASELDASGPFAGGLLPIECASASCAVALVATEGEGFCALLQDGTVACWGANEAGQLGRGEASTGSADPQRIAGLSNVVALDRTCAVDREGAAFCWGPGPFGGEGDASTSAFAPVRLAIPPAKKVSGNSRTKCALVGSGVLCWGSNASGQLGRIDASAAEPPRSIALRPGAAILDLVANEASFVVREDGTMESWGANLLLARESSLSPDPNPMPTIFERVLAMDVAEQRVCVAVGGDAYCWGDDIGPTPRKAITPEPVVQIATTASTHDARDPEIVVKLARWCAVSTGGVAYCFGENGTGQAGDGTKNYAPRAVQVAGLPGKAARIKTTYDATCVLQTNGEIYCVGSNYYGQLGDGVMRRSSVSPVKVSLP